MKKKNERKEKEKRFPWGTAGCIVTSHLWGHRTAQVSHFMQSTQSDASHFLPTDCCWLHFIVVPPPAAFANA